MHIVVAPHVTQGVHFELPHVQKKINYIGIKGSKKNFEHLKKFVGTPLPWKSCFGVCACVLLMVLNVLPLLHLRRSRSLWHHWVQSCRTRCVNEFAGRKDTIVDYLTCCDPKKTNSIQKEFVGRKVLVFSILAFIPYVVHEQNIDWKNKK